MKELCLTELRRIARVVAATHAEARVGKLVQPGATEVALLLGGRDRRWLLLSARPRAARASTPDGSPVAPPKPPAFAQHLRAHYEGLRLTSAEVEGDERQLRLRFKGGEGEEDGRSLLLSILGPRSNLYALDAADRVTAALRPLRETRRDLSLGGPWHDPPGGPPAAGEDRFAELPDEELLAEVERVFGAAEEGAAEAALVRRIASALRKQRAALTKKLALVEKDLTAQADAERLSREGELLKANLREVTPGQASVTLRDFTTAEPVEVTLDPKLSPSANLEQIFKRARKAEKRARKAAGDVDAVRERVAALDALDEEAAAASEGEALTAFAARSEVTRMLERFAPAPASETAEPAPKTKNRVFRLGKTELPLRLTPKIYKTLDGLEIWVGKNDQGNDVLTTRLARGKDLFFHLEGSPGSHVILRTEGRGDPPAESLLDAAELSVEFSRAKNATNASVHVAAVKDISKPRGAKPGLVYVHRGRTIQLRRDPKRLERVLKSRTEE
jgi:predicted ribosome quality control (RQC) complex YloA/Tae2 family protein